MRFELGKKQKAEDSGKRYKLELSMIGWVATVAVLLIGVTWVFIFGVLVGRGYRPEQNVPELARIMPSDKKDQAAAGSNNDVLKAEELQFYDSLKEDAPTATENGKTEPASRTPVKTPEKAASQQAGQQQAAQKKAPQEKPAASQQAAEAKAPPQAAQKQTAAASATKSDLLDPPEPAPTSEPAKAATPQPGTAADDADDGDQQVYDYIYQVAAFADPKSAEKFRGQLSGLGLKSSLQESAGESKTWHRVMVHFQGRPEDTRQLRTRLAEIGVDRIILRQKKPI